MSSRPTLIRAAILLAALTALAVVPVTVAPGPVATWAEVDALVKDQKFAEAAKRVDGILRAAEKREDEAQWTKALVRRVQLETGLHGYETAVRLLKDEPWPKGLLAQTTLDLFYAQSLVQYERSYSWEIGKREKVESAGPIDLKAWTRAQILGEAEKAYRRAWDRRGELGKLPVGALGEYVDPNNYPKDVRGTLRDAVSYLFAALYADSSRWTPEQSNGMYRLDLPALLEREGSDADARLADPAAHPVEKLVAILGDLESWHGALGQRPAELEARLERLRRLNAAFSEASDRAAIRKDLEARLPRYRDVPWWSMGMAELADLRRAEDAPDNQIRARAAALEGFRAYPQSPGGLRSSDIVAAIEAPEYQPTSMSSDGLDRRSIRVTHKNLSSLFFRAYRVDFEARIPARTDYGLFPNAEEVRGLVRGGAGPPAAAWEAALPPTPDFREHATYVTPPIRDTGVYVIVVSARPDFAESDNRVSSVTIVLSDLVLATHPEVSAISVRALAGSTGQAVAGVEVALWAYDWTEHGHHRLTTATSDAQGLVRFAWAPGMERRNYFLLAKKGRQIAIESQNIFLSPPSEPADETRALVYTDRAIYRPLQKILWKTVAYRGIAGSGSYRTEAQSPITVTLVDANGQAVESKSLSTNSFGSAAGEFVIPAGRALGRWSVRSSPSGEASVQVEEYKRPTFEVKWEEPKSPLRLNQKAVISGSARYYFGLPVTNGSVRWRIVREPQFPWWWWRWGPGAGGSSQTVAQGTSALKEDGTFEAAFTAAADERLAGSSRDVTYRFAATADVTDEGGETRSAERGFRLGFVAVEAQVRLETGFVREGEPVSITLVRTDLDGAPSPGPGSWRLFGDRATRADAAARSDAARPATGRGRSLRDAGRPAAAAVGHRRVARGGDAQLARRAREGPRRARARGRRARPRSGSPPWPRARGGCATRRGTSSAAGTRRPESFSWRAGTPASRSPRFSWRSERRWARARQRGFSCPRACPTRSCTSTFCAAERSSRADRSRRPRAASSRSRCPRRTAGASRSACHCCATTSSSRRAARCSSRGKTRSSRCRSRASATGSARAIGKPGA